MDILTKRMKKGITLIELIIALVIIAIGLIVVTSFLYGSWKDWFTSKEIKELQEDMDLAGFNIKAILEEANYYEIQDIIEGSNPKQGRKIYVKYTEGEETIWEKAFYPEGTNLIMEDIKNDKKETVIRTLEDIIFSEVSDENEEIKNIVKVNITVSKSGKVFKNEFFVKIRNK